MLDLFGQAMLDFFTNNNTQPIYTETNISDLDEMDAAYLFRNYNQMPEIEQQALNRAFGKVLDIGCGAGSHALFLQNDKNLKVTAIDRSPKAIETCQLRGVTDSQIQDLLEFEAENKFDTILLLMNGTGIFETTAKMPLYLKKLKSLLAPNGQILIDSTDILYMFDEDEQEAVKYSTPYFGELEFTIHYKGRKELPFPWLYLDFETLKNVCIATELECECIYIGENSDYLAKIQHSIKL